MIVFRFHLMSLHALLLPVTPCVLVVFSPWGKLIDRKSLFWVVFLLEDESLSLLSSLSWITLGKRFFWEGVVWCITKTIFLVSFMLFAALKRPHKMIYIKPFLFTEGMLSFAFFFACRLFPCFCFFVFLTTNFTGYALNVKLFFRLTK